MKSKIVTSKAPEALGPYNQAVLIDSLLFCSGQIGINPETKTLVSGGIEAEAKQVFVNLTAVLEEANLSWLDVVKTEIFLKNINDFSVVNDIYKNLFVPDAVLPARQTVEVSNLPKNALIEVSVIAYGKK